MVARPSCNGRRVSESHRPLEWLSRRRAGESAVLIAQRAGVDAETVRHATNPYGPFPRATQHLGRTQLSDDVLSARERRWVAARRRGMTVKEISEAEGVQHRIISRATVEHGPFPAHEVVEDWAEARRSGQTLTEVAQAAGVREGVVRVATRPYGPFRANQGAKTPDGLETLETIAKRCKVAPVTVLQWRKAQRLPAPDFVTARGRLVWLSATIDRWLESPGGPHQTCSICGARCWSVSRHVGHVHRNR